MILQEREKIEVVLTPVAAEARRIDLNNKVDCWEGHIEIARKKGDLRQAEFGEIRLKALRRQVCR